MENNNQYNAQPTYQQPPQQPQYQQPQQPQYTHPVHNYETPWSTGKWIGMMALMTLLPGLGWLIALIVFLTSDNTTVRNFGKAQLILIIISTVLSILFFVVVFLIMGVSMAEFY